MEGTWKLIQCENYEKYLEKIGTGPLSVNMVMRANVVLTITQVPTSSLQPRTVLLYFSVSHLPWMDILPKNH